MYIRIQENTIRYRVSKLEAKQLINEEILEQSLVISPSHTLNYAINLTQHDNQFNYEETSNKLLLAINRDILIKELEQRPSKRGIVFNQYFKDKIIGVSLEIDLKNK